MEVANWKQDSIRVIALMVVFFRASTLSDSVSAPLCFKAQALSRTLPYSFANHEYVSGTKERRTKMTMLEPSLNMDEGRCRNFQSLNFLEILPPYAKDAGQSYGRFKQLDTFFSLA
jgi:hypothetical protein